MNGEDLLFEALLIAGEYARKYPPGYVPSDMNYISIYADGDHRDPQGLEFVDYWMRIAQKKLKERNKENGMV